MFLDNFKEPFELQNHGIRLPEFKLSEEDYSKYGISKEASNLEILTALCRVGFKEKLDAGLIPKSKIKEYGERVKYELGVLERTGFVDYILLVFLVQSFAHKNKLATGVGRGSAASSLVNYIIRITEIDPIRYNLIFERFISESRTKLNIVDGVTYITGNCADIDGDYGDNDRDIIIQYLKELYSNKFVKLSTFGTYTTKKLTKEVGKVFGYNEEYLSPIVDSVQAKFGKLPAPGTVYNESLLYKTFCDDNQLLQYLDYIYHCISNNSSHASAFLVSRDDLDEFMPCQAGESGDIVSAYDMTVANELAIKLDLLGVQTLSLIYGVLNRINKTIHDIDIDDPKIYEVYLANLEHSYGLFQISGDAVVRSLNKLKPANFDELADTISIARPGSFSFIDEYVDVKNQGVQNTTCPNIFKDILEKTKYVCIYQEQLMFMGNRIGFSMEQANELRQVVSKKKTDKIAEWEGKIFEMGRKNSVSDADCKYLWDLALSSADYSFPKSHAYSYSAVAAISVKLKFEYPKEFFLEALEMSQKKQDPFSEIALIQQELPYFGIKLLPPDLIESDMDFKIEGNDIRFGLSAIKGVAEKAFPKLQSFLDKEKTNKFQFFFAAKEAGLNIAVLSALIQAGCLHSLGENRAKLTLEAQIWGKMSEREWNYCLANGEKYGYDLIEALKDYLNWNDGKPFKESRLGTIRKNTVPYIEIYNKNKQYPHFADFSYERALLGFSFSRNIREVFKNEHPDLQSADCIKNQLDKGDSVRFVSITTESQKKKNKKGYDYFKMELSDETGTIFAMMNADKLARYAGGFPKEDEIVYIEGKKGDGIVFVDRMEVQNYKIAFNMRDLKKLKESE